VTDLDNRAFKVQVRFGLRIEETLFKEVEKRSKAGYFTEGYFASYSEEIRKP